MRIGTPRCGARWLYCVKIYRSWGLHRSAPQICFDDGARVMGPGAFELATAGSGIVRQNTLVVYLAPPCA